MKWRAAVVADCNVGWASAAVTVVLDGGIGGWARVAVVIGGNLEWADESINGIVN